MGAARSLLAVPASSRKMVEKALASEADTIFLDLEDAVAPGRKTGARRDVVRAVKELDWGGRPRMFRVNASDTRWFYRDVIEVAEEAGDALDAVLVPKVDRPEDLRAVAVLLDGIELEVGLEPGKIKLEAQVETAEGLTNIDAVARSTGRLRALHFGPGDFAASLGAPQTSLGTRDGWDEAYPGHRFGYVMQRIVVAARAAGLRAVDGPVADHRDEEGLAEACRVARSLGFDGKWCIHPAQVPAVNEIFSPTRDEIEWARRVIRAYEEAGAAGSGAVSLDGQMVDAASIRMARNTLDLAGSEGSRGPEPG
ncbi:MAG: Similar to citrate lyase beta chain, 2 [uncultured Rubrobacteraceae bacterium]|uniref:Similar to citrate lyase beta chain, 2 n=1 Tax=uncultured Rubrobacteraceae bacterium TaxID=349277 RepID=A0A6J4RJB3_9ACTN|nr:MAG: Similar to citrate lyase beta chain, 2 [uncultured Rubrobacteraceae bacterium]